MKGPLYDIVEKPEFISFEAVQETIRVAHESNTEKGLLYATASQSVDTLKKKIGDGVCYVALDRATGSVVGTVTLGIRPLHYWYVNEIVAIIKLFAVHPDYKGGGISKALVDHCIDYAKQRGINIVVSDSAEQNAIIRNLFTKSGFLIVDYGLYAANNFYTTVYAKWLRSCPYPSWYRRLRYRLKWCYIRALYKPRKIKRFGQKD